MIDSARLRAELERILADQARDVRDLAQRVADETWKRVEAGTPAAKAVGEAMDAAGVDEQLQQRLGRDVVQSLCAGAGILPQITAAGLVDQFAAAALVLSWDSSGMPLSSRLHSAQVKADVAHAISSAISRRDDAWRTARKIYDGYGFGGALKAQNLSSLPMDLRILVAASRQAMTPEDMPSFLTEVEKVRKYAQALRTAPLRSAYLQLADKLEKGLSRGLENAVRVAAEEKTRYFAERILRTESARAWGEGFFDQIDRDPDATGLRWETSSAHKIFDVCDFHHRADLFGMGPGVYPKEHRPSYPAHPHCLCVMSAWYRGKAAPQVQEGGKRALDAMSEGERARLLGVKGAEAFNAGGDWKGLLRNWDPPGGKRLSAGAETILKDAASRSRRLSPDALDAAWSEAGGQRELADWRASGKKHPSGIDEREAAMIHDYTGSSYKDLNKALRDGSATAAQTAKTSIIDSGLEGLGPQKYQTLFRGLELGADEAEAFRKEHAVGAEIEWKALTSTSATRNVADQFGSVSVIITDAKGVPVQGLSQIPKENEVLIQSGFRGRVLKVVQLSKGKRVFFIEAI